MSCRQSTLTANASGTSASSSYSAVAARSSAAAAVDPLLATPTHCLPVASRSFTWPTVAPLIADFILFNTVSSCRANFSISANGFKTGEPTSDVILLCQHGQRG
ncbi:hypothetical protein T07_7594 [Trichinella nelsoni]|uniref:Uncharacterized protein n=1 Tax=Trichinella nelsoni TaxID=6336 RepID=A0A0V0RSH6_9BILA|nr:hypothetical protein T07_7594 [Trichinella nelsoni]